MEVFFFAVVRGGCHQQQVPGSFTDALGKSKASGFFEFGSEVVCGQFVGFVEYDQIPASFQQFDLQISRRSSRWRLLLGA